MRTRRGPALAVSLLLAVPVLAACSGSADDDVRAAARALGEEPADDAGAAWGMFRRRRRGP